MAWQLTHFDGSSWPRFFEFSLHLFRIQLVHPEFSNTLNAIHTSTARQLLKDGFNIHILLNTVERFIPIYTGVPDEACTFIRR